MTYCFFLALERTFLSEGALSFFGPPRKVIPLRMTSSMSSFEKWVMGLMGLMGLIGLIGLIGLMRLMGLIGLIGLMIINDGRGGRR